MAKPNIKGLKGKAVRILRDLHVDGVPYKAGQVVAFAQSQAEALQKDGSVDGHPESVGYALEQGEQAVQHTLADVDDGKSAPAPTPAPTHEPTPAPTQASDAGVPTNDPVQ